MLRSTIIFTVLLISLASCEEPVDWEFQPGENGTLVVDAILTDELGIQELRLTRSYDDLNGEASPISATRVTVSNGQQSYLFTATADDATLYQSNEPFRATIGEALTLEVEWEGQNFLATNAAVPIAPLGQLDFQEVLNGDSLALIPPPIYTPAEQAMYVVDVDWSHLSNVEPTQARLYSYSFRTFDVNEVFRDDLESVFFPRGSIAIVRKYALNDDFAAYLRSLIMEKDWRGGIYDELPSSLPSNLTNGGLGFFAVAAALRDTLEVQ